MIVKDTIVKALLVGLAATACISSSWAAAGEGDKSNPFNPKAAQAAHESSTPRDMPPDLPPGAQLPPSTPLPPATNSQSSALPLPSFPRYVGKINGVATWRQPDTYQFQGQAIAVPLSAPR